MNSEVLSEFLQVKEEILEEKRMIERRLKELDQALSETTASTIRRKLAQSAPVHLKNRMTLREAVRRVISSEAKTKSEIVMALKRHGYQFDTETQNERLESILKDLIHSHGTDPTPLPESM